MFPEQLNQQPVILGQELLRPGHLESVDSHPDEPRQVMLPGDQRGPGIVAPRIGWCEAAWNQAIRGNGIELRNDDLPWNLLHGEVIAVAVPGVNHATGEL